MSRQFKINILNFFLSHFKITDPGPYPDIFSLSNSTDSDY